MSTLTTIYRVLVMGGTLAVVWMAWQVYGPPPERVRPVWNRVVEVVREALHGESESFEVAHDSHLREGASAAEPDTLLEPLSPRLFPSDQPIQPIAHWQEPAPELLAEPLPGAEPLAESTAPESVAGVVTRLRQLGIADYSLSPWGTSGEIYRFRCSAPWGSGGTFHRHFEAVAANPTEAALHVLSQVEAWQQSQASRENGEAQIR